MNPEQKEKEKQKECKKNSRGGLSAFWCKFYVYRNNENPQNIIPAIRNRLKLDTWRIKMISSQIPILAWWLLRWHILAWKRTCTSAITNSLVIKAWEKLLKWLESSHFCHKMKAIRYIIKMQGGCKTTAAEVLQKRRWCLQVSVFNQIKQAFNTIEGYSHIAITTLHLTMSQNHYSAVIQLLRGFIFA